MKVNLKSLTEEEQLNRELQSVHFNIHFNKSRQYEPIVKSLLSSYGGKYEREVRSIVTNTARMIKSRGTHLRIPRNDRPYTNNTQRISVVRIKELLDLLEMDGLVSILCYLQLIYNWRLTFTWFVLIWLYKPIIEVGILGLD